MYFFSSCVHLQSAQPHKSAKSPSIFFFFPCDFTTNKRPPGKLCPIVTVNKVTKTYSKYFTTLYSGYNAPQQIISELQPPTFLTSRLTGYSTFAYMHTGLSRMWLVHRWESPSWLHQMTSCKTDGDQGRKSEQLVWYFKYSWPGNFSEPAVTVMLLCLEGKTSPSF